MTSTEILQREDAEHYLFWAMEIGEKMLTSGAEVGRVEDSIRRICMAYGAKRVDVFSITSCIIATVYGEAFDACTQTRRVAEMKNNLHMLDELNRLSRRICDQRLMPEEIKEEVTRIASEPPYPFAAQLFFYALVSCSFCIFFGGSLKDALASAVIGVMLKVAETFLQKGSSNPMIITLLCAVVGGLLSNLAVKFGLGEDADLISIGNIMLFIPGMAFTNAIRDIFSRDMIAGGVRFAESIILAIVIALGFTFTGLLF